MSGSKTGAEQEKERGRRLCLKATTKDSDPNSPHVCRRRKGHKGEHLCGKRFGGPTGKMCRYEWAAKEARDAK